LTNSVCHLKFINASASREITKQKWVSFPLLVKSLSLWYLLKLLKKKEVNLLAESYVDSGCNWYVSRETIIRINSCDVEINQSCSLHFVCCCV